MIAGVMLLPCDNSKARNFGAIALYSNFFRFRVYRRVKHMESVACDVEKLFLGRVNCLAEK
jgi:hypothetical protein